MRDIQAIVVKRKKSPYMQQRIVNGPRAFSDLGEKFRRETILKSKNDMRKKIYKEMAHQHLIESLRSLNVIHFQLGNEKEAKRFEEMREDMNERLEGKKL